MSKIGSGGNTYTGAVTINVTGVAEGSVSATELASDAVTTAKIANEAVTSTKVAKSDEFANRFILADITPDKYINGNLETAYPGNPGQTGAISNYIPVTPGETITWTNRLANGASTFTGTGARAYYTSDKSFLSNTSLSNPAVSQSEVVPAGAHWVRFNVVYTNIGTVSAIGNIGDKYEVAWLELADESVDGSKLLTLDTELESNLFDKTAVITGEFVNTSGGITVQAGYSSGHTDYVSVDPSTIYELLAYISNPAAVLWWYDASHAVISAATFTLVNGSIYRTTSPATAAYMRLNYSSTLLNATYFSRVGRRFTIDWLRLLAKNFVAGTIEKTHLSATLQGLIDSPTLQDDSITLDKLTDEAVLALSSTEILDGSVTLASLSQSVIDYIADPVTPANPFDGAKSTWIGDSITAGVGASDASHRFANLVVAALSMNQAYLQNLGVSGTTITKHASVTTSFVERICDGAQISSDRDFIFIMGGLNDFVTNRPLTDFATAKAYFAANAAWDEYDFHGALNRLITYIRDNHGTANLIFLVPYHFYANAGYNENVANTQGKLLKDYVAAIREVCEYWAVPVIDLFRDLPLDPKNTTHYNTYTSFSNGTPDGCHPSDAGNAMIAKKIVNYLKYQYVI